MTIERYRNDDPRTAEEVADAIEDTFRTLNSNASLIEGTQNYALVQSVATAVADQQESALNALYDAGFVTDASGLELTKKAAEFGVQRRSAVAATGVVEFSRSSSASTDYVIPSGTRVATGGEDSVEFVTTEKTTIQSGTTSAKANVECQTKGVVGNVGQGTITVLVDKPTGVESVTNNNPTGDPQYTLTDGSTEQRPGRNREDDAALRQRVLDTRSRTELAIQAVDGVISVNIESNQTASTVNGLDPYHTEVQVYGGATTAIAEELRSVLPPTSLLRLQGGVNGTKETATIAVEPLDSLLTIPITRPSKTNLAVEMDVVVTSEYAGDTDVKNAIVNYVGGMTVDDSKVFGLGQDQNVLVNEIERRAESVSGVDYANVTLVDADGDGTDDTTTDADGVPVYDVGASEVPLVDAEDVTLTVTQR